VVAVLDLDQLDKLDPQKDLAKFATMIEDVYHTSQPYLQRLGRIWDENINFFEGNHHIYYDELTRRYEVIPTNQFNKWIPRPTTNVILPIVMTMLSLLTKQKPSATIDSNSDDTADVNAAKLAGRIQDAKWDIDQEQLKHIQAGMIALLCGTVFRKDIWDSAAGPYSDLLGGAVGDNAVEIIDPFRLIPDMQHGCWFVEASVQPLYWIKQQYGQQNPPPMGELPGLPGAPQYPLFTGLAQSVKENTELSPLLTIHQRLKSVAGRGTDQSLTGGDPKANLKGCAIVLEAYVKPTPKNPKGLLIVVADKKVLYLGPVPYFDPRYEDSWHPYTPFKWVEVPFRYHGISHVENIVPMNRRLNSIDSLIILNRMTMVSPQWLLPKNCGVQEGFINGAPGLNITYNPVGANGAKPEKIPGVGLGAEVYKEREALIEAIHEIALDAQVLAGENPEGITAGVALNLLVEQAMSKFSPVIQGWEKFIENGQSKKLRIIASRYIEPRPQFINKLKSLNKDNLDVEISDFIGTDLRDNVNVRIEAGSSLPRSKTYELSIYQQLAQAGMFGVLDPNQNPIGNQQFLELFGIKPIET